MKHALGLERSKCKCKIVGYMCKEWSYQSTNRVLTATEQGTSAQDPGGMI